jgi:biopolymer transport protein ExbB
MDSLLNFLVDYKVADVAIISIGFYAMVLVMERFKALFIDYSLPAVPFMKQVTRLINEDKMEEALTFCSANEKKPLAYVIKRILERSDRDEKSIECSLDIASSEVAPKLAKRLGQVQMVSNVVTLVGLFGTVIGLIVAFKALSFADVSQKQTILAQGISIAMTATAAALLVAIPTMFSYTFLFDKQNKLFAEIDEHSQKVIELLRDRVYAPFKTDSAYPTTIHTAKVSTPRTPPEPTKGKTAA